MQQVLEALPKGRRKLTSQQIAAATGLPEPEVDKALQALLLRREVQCDSYQPPGRGGQVARWIGSSREALWSVHRPPLRDRRP